MMFGWSGLLVRFWIATNSGSIVSVPLQAATIMAALGAPALAYSTSRAASPVSSIMTGGLVQLVLSDGCAGLIVVKEPGGCPDRPKVWRNVIQSSAEAKFVGSTSAMVCPWPL